MAIAPTHSGPVFISSSGEDAGDAAVVSECLQQAGMATADPATSLALTTQKIRCSSAFVVLLSRSAVRSARIRREVSVALDAKVPMVAVRIEPVEVQGSLGYALTGVTWTDAIARPMSLHQASLAAVVRGARAGQPPLIRVGGAWGDDPEIEGMQRYAEDGAWTNFQRPSDSAVSILLDPPRIWEVPGWRFTDGEEGIALWDGRRYTRFILLPASVRDLPYEELLAGLRADGDSGRASRSRAESLLKMDDHIRDWTLQMVGSTRALEIITEYWGCDLPVELWSGNGVGISTQGEISSSDGRGSVFGRQLGGGVTSRSRTLQAANIWETVADVGHLAITTSAITFAGEVKALTADVAGIGRCDHNANRGEASIDITASGERWHFVGLAPEAAALSSFIATTGGALTPGNVWCSAADRTDLLKGWGDELGNVKHRFLRWQLKDEIGKYINRLPEHWRPIQSRTG